MAFSMHSHSGQFCPGHAQDDLETIIQTAISRSMISLALTEHMPRESEADRYPEELESVSVLRPRHEAFLVEALRLRQKYYTQIQILIGFEGEWIRPSYASLIADLAASPHVDFYIGSVHHVHEIPIDYDAAFYDKARDVAGSEEKLFEDYFDSQYDMLKAVRPWVVGHLDLIRLFSAQPGRDLREWKGVWERVVRNLEEIVRQGGLVEVNTSALRKGLDEPYPAKPICQEFLKLGGKLTFSDDSHGVAQVATNYGKAMGFLEGLGVRELWLLEPGKKTSEVTDSGKKDLVLRSVSLESIKASLA